VGQPLLVDPALAAGDDGQLVAARYPVLEDVSAADEVQPAVGREQIRRGNAPESDERGGHADEEPVLLENGPKRVEAGASPGAFESRRGREVILRGAHVERVGSPIAGL
jgi:hypothetical protein